MNGYSLIELNITLLIMLFVCLVGYPMLGVMHKREALHKEIRLLYGNMQKAKIEAVKRNGFTVFIAERDGYRIFDDNGNGSVGRGDWVRQPNEQVIVSHRFSDEVHMDHTTFTLHRTRFNGRVCMKAGRVVLEDSEGRQSEIVISPVGRMRIVDRKRE